MGCCCLPLKSQTNSEQQERNKWQDQKEPRVKVGHESKRAKGQDGLLWLKTAVKTIQVERSQLGPGPFWLRVKLGQGVNMGRKM